MEIWRDIKNYEGLYQISNLGRVKSLNYNQTGREQVLKPAKNNYGYLVVNLYKNGKQKMFLVHRLVTTAFLPNLFDFEQVNHKDENKENNFVGTPENDFNDGNLEWCDRKYNINYGTRTEKTSKKVLQLTLNGKLVKEWPSTSEAGRCGYIQAAVCFCCNGERKTHKGFRWEYKK